jgi:8-oxo-dGTP diphosphatase
MVEPCAGGIVFDASRRLLLIRRGREPGLGRWSVPGGRCLAGESPAAACLREVAEETGLTVAVVRPVGRVSRDGPGGVVYDITDYLCTLSGGELRAGDDALEARWATRAELDELELVPELLECLTLWGVLPD